MQLLRLIGPAALVALASAQFYDDEQFDILAREEDAPGYDDLGFFIRDVDHDDILELKAREADIEELLFSDATDITLSAREADQFGDFDSLIALEERDAEADAEAAPEPEPKKKKGKKKGKKRKSKKNRKHKKKGKKSKKGKKGKKGKSKKSKAAKKKAAARKKAEKEDADLWI